MTMTDETQVETPIEDAPVLPTETDSSPEVESVKADDASPVEQPRDEDGKFLSANAQKRIDALTREKYDREREAQYWREQALQHQPKPEPEVKVAEKLPTLEEFGYDEAKYQSALIQYATQKAEEAVNKRFSEADKQRAEQTRAGKFLERVQEVARANPDFDPNEIFQRQFYPVSETMREVMMDSDSGAELLHWVHNNQDQAAKIANLPPHLAAKEMGRIEALIEARKEAKSRPPTVSKAPPPPPRVEESEVSVAGIKTSDPASDKLSDAEWRAMRDKELKRRKA